MPQQLGPRVGWGMGTVVATWRWYNRPDAAGPARDFGQPLAGMVAPQSWHHKGLEKWELVL